MKLSILLAAACLTGSSLCSSYLEIALPRDRKRKGSVDSLSAVPSPVDVVDVWESSPPKKRVANKAYRAAVEQRAAAEKLERMRERQESDLMSIEDVREMELRGKIETAVMELLDFFTPEQLAELSKEFPFLEHMSSWALAEALVEILWDKSLWTSSLEGVVDECLVSETMSMDGFGEHDFRFSDLLLALQKAVLSDLFSQLSKDLTNSDIRKSIMLIEGRSWLPPFTQSAGPARHAALLYSQAVNVFVRVLANQYSGPIVL